MKVWIVIRTEHLDYSDDDSVEAVFLKEDNAKAFIERIPKDDSDFWTYDISEWETSD